MLKTRTTTIIESDACSIPSPSLFTADPITISLPEEIVDGARYVQYTTSALSDLLKNFSMSLVEFLALAVNKPDALTLTSRDVDIIAVLGQFWIQKGWLLHSIFLALDIDTDEHDSEVFKLVSKWPLINACDDRLIQGAFLVRLLCRAADVSPVRLAQILDSDLFSLLGIFGCHKNYHRNLTNITDLSRICSGDPYKVVIYLEAQRDFLKNPEKVFDISVAV